MKKLINTVLLVAMIFGFSVTGISALSYNYGGTVSFIYTGVSQTVTKTSPTSQKALVNANKVGFNYWFRTVDYATSAETGCKYVNQYGSNLSLSRQTSCAFDQPLPLDTHQTFQLPQTL